MSTPRDLPTATPAHPSTLKLVRQSKAAERMQNGSTVRPVTDSESESEFESMFGHLFDTDSGNQVAAMAAEMVAEAPTADELRTHPAWR